MAAQGQPFLPRTRYPGIKVEDILLDRLIMAQEWSDLQAKVQAEMLMYAHYENINWPCLHRQVARIAVPKSLQDVQKKVKKRVRSK